jgi:anti-sigma B factor antagonist
MMNPLVRCIRASAATLDARSASALLHEATGAMDAGARRLVIDLTGVNYMDSIGISALVAVLRRAPVDARVCLAGLEHRARAIVRMTRLYEVFDIYPSVADALHAEGRASSDELEEESPLSLAS